MKKLYQKALVKFLKAKNEYLKSEIMDVRAPEYFDKLDEKNILKWNDEQAKQIYERIKLNIKSKETIAGLYSDTCPWCIDRLINYVEEDFYCECVCEYGENHGVCENDSFYDNCDHDSEYCESCIEYENCDYLSDWRKLNKFDFYISNDFYKKLIEEIDNWINKVGK